MTCAQQLSGIKLKELSIFGSEEAIIERTRKPRCVAQELERLSRIEQLVCFAQVDKSHTNLQPSLFVLVEMTMSIDND
eukprot:1157214-Pelagomonas_calceolata.AAC.2